MKVMLPPRSWVALHFCNNFYKLRCYYSPILCTRVYRYVFVLCTSVLFRESYWSKFNSMKYLYLTSGISLSHCHGLLAIYVHYLRAGYRRALPQKSQQNPWAFVLIPLYVCMCMLVILYPTLLS